MKFVRSYCQSSSEGNNNIEKGNGWENMINVIYIFKMD